jgi:MFS family permease
MAQASATLAGILSPFIGGLIIQFTNFAALFFIGSVFLFIAMIPLFMTKDTYEKITFDRKNIILDMFKKENLPLLFSFSGYAVESWIGLILWPIFLFILAISIESIGAITSIAALLTFLVFYFIGKATDTGDKKRLLKIGTFLYFFGWIGRIFVSGATSALFIDTYKNIAQNALNVPWATCFYDIAAKRNYFKSIVQREIIFNFGRMIVLPFIMLIFLLDLSYAFTLAFAIAALASLFYVSINKKVA